MPGTYTYNPKKLSKYGVDRMRFELGDTVVDVGELASPLCDEEYKAMIDEHKNWRSAKIACLRAIVMKLSYEVDTRVGDLSYSLSDRFKRWKTLLAEEEKKAAALGSVPIGNPDAMTPAGNTPYFYNDMHANPRRF